MTPPQTIRISDMEFFGVVFWKPRRLLFLLQKRCLYWFPDMRVNFAASPPNRIFGPKAVKYWPLWPFYAMPNQYNNANEVLRWIPKVLPLPILSKNGHFCQKICTFGHFEANLGLAGSFGSLLVGWLLVLARGLLLR